MTAILCRKGGAEKTALALHLAAAAERAGRRAAIFDPQGSAVLWSDDRTAARPCLSRHLDRQPAGGSSEFVVTASQTAELAAACAADLVAVPRRPSLFDPDTVKASLARTEDRLYEEADAFTRVSAGAAARAWPRRWQSTFRPTGRGGSTKTPPACRRSTGPGFRRHGRRSASDCKPRPADRIVAANGAPRGADGTRPELAEALDGVALAGRRRDLERPVRPEEQRRIAESVRAGGEPPKTLDDAVGRDRTSGTGGWAERREASEGQRLVALFRA